MISLIEWLVAMTMIAIVMSVRPVVDMTLGCQRSSCLDTATRKPYYLYPSFRTSSGFFVKLNVEKPQQTR